VTRTIRAFVCVLVACFVTLILWPWITRLPPAAIDDDGYFYATIAYHAGVDGLFSFDGIHPTDGFHLLWGYLLAGGSFLLSWITTARGPHLYLSCVLSVATMALIADLFGRRPADKVLLFGLGMMGMLLLETHLLALLMLALVVPNASRAGFHASPVRYALLAAAISLTRIDATIVSLTWAACLMFAGHRRLASAVAAGAVAGAALQLGLNWLTAGAWFSVAADIKATRALGRGARFVYWTYPGRRLVMWLLLVTSLVAVWRHARVTGDRHPLFAWCAIAAFAIPHLLLVMRPWYFVPGFLGWTAVLLALRDISPPATARFARAGLAVAWLGLVAFVVYEIAVIPRFREEARAIEDFVKDVQRIVPPGSPIYQIDGSGYIGFFSERPIVNGDGLVNTHEYAARTREGRLAGYLDEEGIEYIITNRVLTSPAIVDRGGLVVLAHEVDELARKRGPVVYPYTNFRLFRRRSVGQAGRPDLRGAVSAGWVRPACRRPAGQVSKSEVAAPRPRG
jgi:hypothetical protein